MANAQKNAAVLLNRAMRMRIRLCTNRLPERWRSAEEHSTYVLLSISLKEQKEKSNEYVGVNKHIIRYTNPFTIPLKDIAGIVLWHDNNNNQYFPCAFTLLVAV